MTQVRGAEFYESARTASFLGCRFGYAKNLTCGEVSTSRLFLNLSSPEYAGLAGPGFEASGRTQQVEATYTFLVIFAVTILLKPNCDACLLGGCSFAKT